MSTELVEDPGFRQRYRFSREGDVLRVEMWTDPGGGVLLEHYHPRIEPATGTGDPGDGIGEAEVLRSALGRLSERHREALMLVAPTR